MFLRYIGTLCGLTVYRTEWCIFGDEERLAGSVDMVATNSDGDLILFDWKRSTNLRHKYINPFQRMLPPLQHLEDCQGYHYRLQLNCYRYLIQKYYGFRVAGMRVVCTHPDNSDSAFVDSVPVMDRETELLMDVQRARVREIYAMMTEDLNLYDPPGRMDVEGQAPANEDDARMIEELADTLCMAPADAPDEPGGEEAGPLCLQTEGTMRGADAVMVDAPNSSDPPGRPGVGTQCSEHDLDAAIEDEARLLDELAETLWMAPPDVPGESGEAHTPHCLQTAGAASSSNARLEESSDATPCPPPAAGSGALSQAILPEETGDDLPPDASDRDGLGPYDTGATLEIGKPASHSDEEEEAVAGGCASAFHGRAKRFRGAETSNADFEAMFETCCDAAAKSMSSAPGAEETDSDGILARTHRIRGIVKERLGSSSESLVRLATAALSIYRMRLVDLFIREHVLLLWIIEGGTYMRVHGGICYFYGLHGSFEAYKGQSLLPFCFAPVRVACYFTTTDPITVIGIHCIPHL